MERVPHSQEFKDVIHAGRKSTDAYTHFEQDIFVNSASLIVERVTLRFTENDQKIVIEARCFESRLLGAGVP